MENHMSVFISYRRAMDRNAISVERLTVLANAQWTSLQVPFEKYVSEFFSAFSNSSQLGKILKNGVHDASRTSMSDFLHVPNGSGSSRDMRKAGAVIDIACDFYVNCQGDEVSGCISRHPVGNLTFPEASPTGTVALDYFEAGLTSGDHLRRGRDIAPVARCIFFWTPDGSVNAHIAPTFDGITPDCSQKAWSDQDLQRNDGLLLRSGETAASPEIINRTPVYDRMLEHSSVCILYCHGIDFPFIENYTSINTLPMQIDSCLPQARKRGSSSQSGKSPIVFSDSSQSLVSMHRRPERSLRKLFKLKDKMSVPRLGRRPKSRSGVCTVLPFPGSLTESVAQVRPEAPSIGTDHTSGHDVDPWSRQIEDSLLKHVSLRNLGRNIRRMREERERWPLPAVPKC